MSRHTPGPWARVRHLGSPHWTLGTIRGHVAKPLPEENSEADWTLAEAAPDLLEALEAVLQLLDVGLLCPGSCRPGVDEHEEDCPEGRARAAIAKAKGAR